MVFFLTNMTTADKMASNKPSKAKCGVGVRFLHLYVYDKVHTCTIYIPCCSCFLQLQPSGVGWALMMNHQTLVLMSH